MATKTNRSGNLISDFRSQPNPATTSGNLNIFRSKVSGGRTDSNLVADREAEDVFMWSPLPTGSPQQNPLDSSFEKYITARSKRFHLEPDFLLTHYLATFAGGFVSDSESIKLDDNVDLQDYNGFEEAIKLPALPSEMGRGAEARQLPVPKHLASDAVSSESNSDDESTASSSSGQL